MKWSVEVEGFETQGLFENVQSGQVVTQPLRRTLAPIRRAISRAAKQMKSITNRPLIIVLANPANLPLPLNPPHVIAAMYGDLQFGFPADRQQAGYWRAGRNGRLHLVDKRGVERGNHDYISAIAIVREGANVAAWTEAWWAEHGAQPTPRPWRRYLTCGRQAHKRQTQP